MNRDRSVASGVVTVLALIVGGVLAWRAITTNMAEFYAREPGSAATALLWEPRHPYALYEGGIAQIAGDAGLAARQLTEAIRENPSGGRSYAALARLREASGDVQAAERAMEAAAAMAPQRTDVQAEAAAFWMRRGSVARALLHWDVVLTFDAELRARLFPDLLVLAEHPEALRAFDALLKAREASWWQDFLAYAVANARQIDTVRALFAMRPLAPDDGRKRHDTALKVFLNRLQQEGLWTEAYVTWLNTLAKEQINTVGNLFNGGFEYPLSNIGFDWVVQPVQQVSVETISTHGSTGSKALYVAFRGSKTAYRHLRQNLLLPPGSYALRGRVRPEALETSHGLQWSVVCPGANEPLATSERFLGSDHWRHFSVQFVVPANCPVQTLRLELAGRATLDFEARGGIWFDDMIVERQRTR